ncbi:MAG: hypothetical protein IJN80_08260 [Clostridia bacterium]|nr:hypothetical protein [Clostridia bacterium]
MNQKDLFSQIKNMDKGEQTALLGKIMNALSPDQQKMVQSVVGDQKKMQKIQNNLKNEDISALLSGLAGDGNPQDFLQSPQVINRLKDLLG